MFLLILNLMLAVFLLELGSGLQGVLVPIRGELAGFSTPLIGTLGTTYYIGFVLGCLILPRTVRRFGHIRCFSALAAVAASTMLLHALIVLPWVWLVFRLGIGLCFAGLFMVVESWLNDQTTSDTRGRALGLYMVATWLGVIGGKLLFSTAPPDTFQLFSVASIAIGLSLVPIALTTSAVPSIPEPARMGWGALYRNAPVGLLGCVGVGIANGAFWGFAPLFAQARSTSAWEVSLFMSACVVGGMLVQWPIGRFSDRVDRRWVIFGTCLTAALAGVLLTLQRNASDGILLVLGAGYGASSLSIYSLCVAHANDRADPTTFVEVSSHLLLAFGLGAIVGPFMVSLLISEIGTAGLFIFTASIHAALALFVFIRTRTQKPTPEDERSVFSPQPPEAHGTQAVLELQPGMEQVEEGIAEQNHTTSNVRDDQSIGQSSPLQRDES